MGDKNNLPNTTKSWKDLSSKEKNSAVIALVIIALIIISVFGAFARSSSGNDTLQLLTQATPESTSTADSKPAEQSVPTEYASALYKATTYADTMHMSKKGIYDQLVSEYGEQFTPEAAQYAIDNVVSDWNANALAKAKTYQNDMHMSSAAIHDQLTSEYGEQFTQAEADYAIAHLNE